MVWLSDTAKYITAQDVFIRLYKQCYDPTSDYLKIQTQIHITNAIRTGSVCSTVGETQIQFLGKKLLIVR